MGHSRIFPTRIRCKTREDKLEGKQTQKIYWASALMIRVPTVSPESTIDFEWKKKHCLL